MAHLQGVFRPVCCYMLPVLAVLLGAAVSSGTRISCAAAGENAPGPDTLAEIEQMLPSHPPAWEHGTARAAIAGALDRQVTVQVRDAMTDEERVRLKPLLEFYRRRVDVGLDALEHTPVSAGVLVVKFYSSSLVLKSAAGTVALDFCQGPINNGGEPEVRDDRRTGFYWTLEQRERLARLVDVSLITHRHHDHADYSLSRQLVAQRKAVVGPGQLKELWPDLASGITVPDYDQEQRVGPVEIFTMRGRQYSRNAPGADGQREGVPGENPDKETESVVYLLRVGGLVFLQGAENHVPATEWLRRGIAQGWNPNIVLSVGQYQGQRSVDAVLSQQPPVFRIPVHEYELMHEGGGNRTLPWFSGEGARHSTNTRACHCSGVSTTTSPVRRDHRHLPPMIVLTFDSTTPPVWAATSGIRPGRSSSAPTDQYSLACRAVPRI